MRINKYVAQSSNLSRRGADDAIASGRVHINGALAQTGQEVSREDVVTLDGKRLVPKKARLLMLNKPVGYVCSRQGQGSKTIFELLPKPFQDLQPIGRLDKDSSGLLLLTNDGDLAQQLTHPSNQKTKTYEISLNKPLSDTDNKSIRAGVQLEDGPSTLQLKPLGKDHSGRGWHITMHEGRNRQIRRTFAALGYTVKSLHRTTMGSYALGNLAPGEVRELSL